MSSKPDLATPSTDERVVAMKSRIISHMNADHAESLKLYLRNYCGVPATRIGSPKLSDITLDHIIIESDVGRNLVNFRPPMKSFAESRERLVAMHDKCLSALGLSDIQINEYVLPQRVWQWGLLFLCLWCYVTFPFPERIAPSSASFMSYGWSVGGWAPGLAQLASQLAPIVLPSMLAIHTIETVYFWRSRLVKHSLSITNPAAWLWLVHTFISGMGCIRRFDELVEEKKKAKTAKQH